MKTWEGKEGGTVSPKLDGVYAKATRDGVFSRSGNPLDLPHVSRRLKRHFRKHPDSVLEGEVFRKGDGIEKIAGAVKSGGEATKRLRLHIFPKDGEKRPWSIGAVRRVQGKKAADSTSVQKIFDKALKRGHEGVVVRDAAGVPAKLKPKQDAEWEVAKVHGGPRGVLSVKQGDRTFKVQSKPGLTAKAGDRVQVSYSGTTRKGTPKAAVAQRVRNNNDFSIIMKTTIPQTPARALLGAAFFEFDPYARVELSRGETVEDEIARDRRTLKRIGVGAALAGGAVATVIHQGKNPKPAVPPPLAVVQKSAPKVKAKPKSYWSKKRPAARVRSFMTPARRLGVINLEEKRDRLSKARDVAVIAGTGAVGAGVAVGAHQARKLRKTAGAALGHAGSATARTARQIRETVTPKAVAREGLKLVKEQAKKKAVEYFPTFTRAAKALKNPVKLFATPAQRLGVMHELATSDQLVTKDKKTYASPLKVAAGTQEAYRRNSNTAVDLPIGDMQVVKAAYRKAEGISKWGTRGGRLAKDAVDVIAGKPRSRDASGRKKKREWEKGWASEAAKKAIIAGGVLGWATGMKRSPRFRDANLRAAKAVKDKVNEHLPNTFATPAREILLEVGAVEVLDFARKEQREDRTAIKAGLGGAVAGAGNGAVLGVVSAAGSRQADDYFRVKKLRETKGGDGGGVMVADRPKGDAFRSGKFGRGERLARAEHNSLGKLKKTIRNRSVAGGVAGAALLGGASYAATKAATKAAGEGKRKRFTTPAQRLGVIALDAAASEAGWDVRDPRGRSARVFAPGSRKRVRREKTWREEVGNERKLWKGAVIGAGLAAGAAGVAIGRRLPKKAVVPNDTIVPFPKRKNA